MKIFWLGIPITEKTAKTISKEKKVSVPDGIEFFGRKCTHDELKFGGIRATNELPVAFIKE